MQLLHVRLRPVELGDRAATSAKVSTPTCLALQEQRPSPLRVPADRLLTSHVRFVIVSRARRTEFRAACRPRSPPQRDVSACRTRRRGEAAAEKLHLPPMADDASTSVEGRCRTPVCWSACPRHARAESGAAARRGNGRSLDAARSGRVARRRQPRGERARRARQALPAADKTRKPTRAPPPRQAAAPKAGRAKAAPEGRRAQGRAREAASAKAAAPKAPAKARAAPRRPRPARPRPRPRAPKAGRAHAPSRKRAPKAAARRRSQPRRDPSPSRADRRVADDRRARSRARRGPSAPQSPALKPTETRTPDDRRSLARPGRPTSSRPSCRPRASSPRSASRSAARSSSARPRSFPSRTTYRAPSSPLWYLPARRISGTLQSR